MLIFITICLDRSSTITAERIASESVILIDTGSGIQYPILNKESTVPGFQVSKISCYSRYFTRFETALLINYRLIEAIRHLILTVFCLMCVSAEAALIESPADIYLLCLFHATLGKVLKDLMHFKTWWPPFHSLPFPFPSHKTIFDYTVKTSIFDLD